VRPSGEFGHTNIGFKAITQVLKVAIRDEFKELRKDSAAGVHDELRLGKKPVLPQNTFLI
jgi:hypothetical protein